MAIARVNKSEDNRYFSFKPYSKMKWIEDLSILLNVDYIKFDFKTGFRKMSKKLV